MHFACAMLRMFVLSGGLIVYFVVLDTCSRGGLGGGGGGGGGGRRKLSYNAICFVRLPMLPDLLPSKQVLR